MKTGGGVGWMRGTERRREDAKLSEEVCVGGKPQQKGRTCLHVQSGEMGTNKIMQCGESNGARHLFYLPFNLGTQISEVKKWNSDFRNYSQEHILTDTLF